MSRSGNIQGAVHLQNQNYFVTESLNCSSKWKEWHHKNPNNSHNIWGSKHGQHSVVNVLAPNCTRPWPLQSVGWNLRQKIWVFFFFFLSYSASHWFHKTFQWRVDVIENGDSHELSWPFESSHQTGTLPAWTQRMCWATQTKPQWLK